MLCVPVDYLNFELDLGPLENEDTFKLTLLQPPDVDFSIDPLVVHAKLFFDCAEIEHQILRFRNALLLERSVSRIALLPHQFLIQNIGTKLYEVLFEAGMLREFQKAKAQAAKEDKTIRLRLRIRDPLIALLPWEYTFDSELGNYLSLSNNISLVRTLDLKPHFTTVATTFPLRILGVACSSVEHPPLNTTIEKENLEEALRPLIQHDYVDIQWLDNATWQQIFDAVHSNTEWDVFHFIGHGAYDSGTDEGQLIFVTDDGKPDFRSATQVMRLLTPGDFRFVTLNACYGGFAGENDVFSSVAASLLRSGIPSVLAMQYDISDEVAIEFSHQLYQAIAEGSSLEAAVKRARLYASQAIDNYDWGIPAFYSYNEAAPLIQLPEGASVKLSLEKNEEILSIADGFKWPRITPHLPDRITDSHRMWLDDAGYSHNPFSFQSIKNDTGLLFNELNLPHFEDIVDVNTSTCIYSTSREDYRMASTGLLDNILNHQIYDYAANNLGRVFPLPIAFSLEDIEKKSHALQLIAHGIAEWWRELLRLNPQLYIELGERPQIQRRLTTLLIWDSKSLGGAMEVFYDIADAALEPVAKACRKQMREAAKDIKITRITPSNVRAWLNIRPPSRDYTFLLMTFTEDGARKIPERRILSDTLTSVESEHIRIKAFIPAEIRPLFSDFADVELKWSKERLDDELTRRIQNARVTQDANFNTMFEFPFKDYHGGLVEAASGSLGRLLRNGSEIVRNHVRKYPEQLFLVDEDWDDVMREYPLQ